MIDLPKDFDLNNKEFKYAEQLILYTNKSIYLTGKAGTGKSTFMRYIVQNTTKNVIIVAPTGIAAINVGGVTIHSFFQLPFTPFVWERFNNTQKQNFYNFSNEKRRIIQKAEFIIIDEISMVRSDIIDAIDFRLRHFGGKSNLPFGGKQILFVGDTFQLEPIVKPDEWEILKNHYSSPYFFDAKTFQKVKFINIELLKVYRQTDLDFISLLNKVRNNSVELFDFQKLNKCYTPNFSSTDEENCITLATRRDIVDTTNRRQLDKLPGKFYKYEGVIEGKFGNENRLEDDLLPTNRTLELKKDSQVMFVKNDRGGRWINGTIGAISELNENFISVSIKINGLTKTYNVEKVTWDNIKYEIDEKTGKIVERIIGTFTQYPIKLAWAITIHKSQGLTFDNVLIDLGDGAFSAGQTYVALSRCKTFQGIKLKTQLKPSDIIVRNEVINLSRSANDVKVINDVLIDGQADYYYRESIKEFENNKYLNALDSLIKAFEFRNDSLKTLFRRFLSYKLNQFKNKSSNIKTLEKQIIQDKETIEEYYRKIEYKENQVKVSYEECLNLKEKIKNIENEKFDLINRNNQLLNDIHKQSDLYNSIYQINNENKIRIEYFTKTIEKYQEYEKELKKEKSTWKKISIFIGFLFLLMVIYLLLQYY